VITRTSPRFELEALAEPCSSKEGKKRRMAWLMLARGMVPVSAVYFCYVWTVWLYVSLDTIVLSSHLPAHLKGSALFSAGVFFPCWGTGNTLAEVVATGFSTELATRKKARRYSVVAVLSAPWLRCCRFLLHNLRGWPFSESSRFFSEFHDWAPYGLSRWTSGGARGFSGSASRPDEYRLGALAANIPRLRFFDM